MLPEETLADLATYGEPFAPNAPTLRAYEAFSSNSRLYAIAIVDDHGRPIGLLNRFRFLEQLSRPFGRDLLKHRAVSTVMERALVVDERMSLDQLSDILSDDDTKYIFDGFIVTRGGRYLGIGTGFSLMRRLTDRRQAALFHLAHHDALTGLANRQLFGDRLAKALANAERNQRLLGVLYVDVDRFKAVNDSLGHTSGDQLLREIAQRLGRMTRAQDTVARLSGDEFAVLLTEITSPHDAEVVADKLLGTLREAFAIDGDEVNVSCSVGIAVYPQDACSGVSLMRAADDALYNAKQFRNTFQRFCTELQRVRPGTLLAFSALHRAIDTRQLEVHYQPVLVAGTRALHGFEALVRCRAPVDGLHCTQDFIRAAEDAGMIGAVTDFVLRSGMEQLLAWEREGHPARPHLAVNISGIEVRDGALLPLLERHLRDTAFPASRLELEITESTLMRSDARTLSVLRELRRMGVRLAVDDFGTGYSSLGRLQTLPVDALKIDRGFVRGISRADDRDGGAIAQAILMMAHSLGLTVTAEGIETPAQAAFLESQGCERLQGYLLGRPMPAIAVAQQVLV